MTCYCSVHIPSRLECSVGVNRFISVNLYEVMTCNNLLRVVCAFYPKFIIIDYEYFFPYLNSCTFEMDGPSKACLYDLVSHITDNVASTYMHNP
jgi:hypothetical protein